MQPEVTITWVGHATVELEVDGFRAITDPILDESGRPPPAPGRGADDRSGRRRSDLAPPYGPPPPAVAAHRGGRRPCDRTKGLGEAVPVAGVHEARRGGRRRCRDPPGGNRRFTGDRSQSRARRPLQRTRSTLTHRRRTGRLHPPCRPPVGLLRGRYRPVRGHARLPRDRRGAAADLGLGAHARRPPPRSGTRRDRHALDRAAARRADPLGHVHADDTVARHAGLDREPVRSFHRRARRARPRRPSDRAASRRDDDDRRRQVS